MLRHKNWAADVLPPGSYVRLSVTERSMKNEVIVERRWIRLGLIWTVWTLVGFFFSSQLYFSALVSSRPVSFFKALVWQMTAAYVFALATPFVLWLARTFRIERRIWRQRLLFHFLVSILFSIVVAFIHVLNDAWHSPTLTLTWLNLGRWILYLIDKEVLVYWTLVLSSHAFDYYNRFRTGELRAAQLETQLAQAQLQSLKMQLHPHFLFNTLNAIAELVYDSPQRADRVITQLSDLLRLTLESGKGQEVTLKEELEFLKRYVEIQQTLMQGRLAVRFEVNPGTLDACVPNMILQPLVENAIRHGLAPRSRGGRIEIGAERENGMLRLDVHDNGLGLPSSWQPSSHQGIGLSNTRERLLHLYGDAHRFELNETPGGGLSVSLAIPFREYPDESSNESTHIDS